MRIGESQCVLGIASLCIRRDPDECPKMSQVRAVMEKYPLTSQYLPNYLMERVNVGQSILRRRDASEAEEFSKVATKPLRALPYDTPEQTFVAFEKPAGVPVVGKFSNIVKFIVKEVDPSTGEADDDGVEEEHQLEGFA